MKKLLPIALLTRLLRSFLGKASVNGSSFDCISSITIKSQNPEFNAIGTVAEHLVGEVHSEIFSVYPSLDIQKIISRDSFNLPDTCDRELYHGNRHYDWWLSGLYDYLKIKGATEKYGNSIKSGDVFYEMGCASGRVLRHFAIQEDLVVWGSDINFRHIEWMRLNLPDKVRVFQNTTLPNIPIPCNSVNIACAFSVFTHIDDLEIAWICEIRRILKKGGFFYVTIHSEDTWNALNPSDQIFHSLKQMAPFIKDYDINDEFLASPLPRERTVFSWPGNNYNTNIFHKKSYIYREWGRFFKVHEIVRAGSHYQDVVVLQKITD